MDNFDISHSEKDFLGGGRRGREAGGALSGDIVILMQFGLHCKWEDLIGIKYVSKAIRDVPIASTS